MLTTTFQFPFWDETALFSVLDPSNVLNSTTCKLFSCAVRETVERLIKTSDSLLGRRYGLFESLLRQHHWLPRSAQAARPIPPAGQFCL